MNYSNEVEKMVFPIKLVWLALMGSLFIYGIVLYTKGDISFVDLKDISKLKTIIQPLSFIPFLFTFFFSFQKERIIRQTDMDRAPFAKHMEANDKKILSYYSGYFVVHIILWALNEAGAILAFLLSFMSGNISYYLINASIALIINLVLLKPNYLIFIQGKRLE